LMLPKMVAAHAPPMAMSVQPYSDGICMICRVRDVRRASRNATSTPETSEASGSFHDRETRRRVSARAKIRVPTNRGGGHTESVFKPLPPHHCSRRAAPTRSPPRASSRHAVAASTRP
jgi:hypothetical protein